MQPNSRPLIIGITGNIGSGKTTVCQILSQKYPVYYADVIAHQVLQEAAIIEMLVGRWGKEIINDNVIDRKAVAKQIFDNEQELKWLNSVIHPRVLVLMQEIVDKCISDFLCFEVPLLFEANLQNCFDHIVIIHSSIKLRKARVVLRDNLNSEEIDLRLKNQLSHSEMDSQFHTTIENNGSLQELSIAVNAFLENVPNLERRNIYLFNSITLPH